MLDASAVPLRPSPSAGARTVREVLAAAAAALSGAGCETPRLDAELLLAETLGVDRARLVIDAGSGLDAAALAAFQALVERRRSHEPVAYILGRRDFRHLTLAVDRRALIPRPETEFLVEAALELPPGARVIDVGTGSGAVALALAQERADLEVWGSDVSPDALELARHNGQRLGLNVRFVRADLLAGVPGRFDAVLANLPYVASGARLAPDVVDYEPVGALFAGPDGLCALRALVSQLAEIPFVALEVGFDQAAAVGDMLARAGYRSVKSLRDLAGIERVVVSRR